MTESSKENIADMVTEVVQPIIERVAERLGKSQADLLAPLILQYGPAFAAMSVAEVWSWIDLAARGDPYKSYAAIVAKLPNQQLAGEWTSINQKMQTANVQNAVNVAWQRDAVCALLKGLVAIAASLVCL